jgi:hypothetical protein
MSAPDVMTKAYEERIYAQLREAKAHLDEIEAHAKGKAAQGGPEQQGQSHDEKIIRLSHLQGPGTGPLSLTWQATRAGIDPRFLLTSQTFKDEARRD